MAKGQIIEFDLTLDLTGVVFSLETGWSRFSVTLKCIFSISGSFTISEI